MSRLEGVAINEKETGEKFPKISRVEFLRRLNNLDSCAPPNDLFYVKPEKIKEIGLPFGEIMLDGRFCDPIREAIQKSRAGGISGMLAVEVAWEYYNSLAA